jgi:hypothetical protein
MLGVIILSVVMLNVVMLSVVAPFTGLLDISFRCHIFMIKFVVVVSFTITFLWC